MPRYTVRSPLAHDGKHFADGASIDLSEAQAAPLLGAVIEPAAEQAAEAAAKAAPKAPGKKTH